MTSTNGFDIEELRRWIGRSERATDVVTPRLVQGLRATLDQDAATPAEGDPAPSTMHWCLAPPTVPMSGIGPDGHPARGGFLPPVPLPRRMWAGGRLEFRDTLRVGDVVERVSMIAEVTAKEGRSGLLVFVAVDHEISTSRGPAVLERHDIVYRDAAGRAEGRASAAPSEQPSPQWQRKIRSDPVLLFRYSALTFNGHRIHYDRRYCQEEEGYLGLVVHGPLQATYLIEFAAAIRDGRTPRTFSFRGVQPLFDGTEFTVNAVPDGDGIALWIADEDGRQTMTARAAW